jgi:YfiH family protein
MSPPALQAELGPGVLAFFTRREGDGSNLALHVGDDPARVAAARTALAVRAAVPVLFARQVHGTRVAVVGPPDLAARAVLDPSIGDVVSSDPAIADPCRRDLGQDDAGYDAVVVIGASVAAGVLVADCVPVLLADPRAGVVAAVHAGRKGLLDGVLTAALSAMAVCGAQPGRIRAALGPSAGGCCYEVPESMRREAAALLPATAASTRRGTPALDLRAGCRSVLLDAGVAQVTLLGGCTIEDESSFSYRRTPVTGRFAGVVRMLG